MKKCYVFLILLISIFVSCKQKIEKTKSSVANISESIYASGTIKSKDQYLAFATVNGIIDNILVSEGDSVKVGTPILSISNEAQRLGKENAELAARFSDFNVNQDKLKEAKLFIELALNKLKNDSALYFRQVALWQQQVGSKVELEQRDLNYQNAKTAYFSANVKYQDLKRQLDFTSSQSKKNLLISSKLERDYTLKSEIDGVVYELLKAKGEQVGLQTPLAVIGNCQHFILEMQVDEYDIFKIQKGLKVLVTMDSYKGKVFEAYVSKIYPFMNERSKTFLVEAEFEQRPKVLYPNVTFEANIILQTKPQAILIPRNYLLNDSIVIKSNGEKVIVKTGLKDYQKIEIISGVNADEELLKPTE
ncbi:MAG: efflux RND transporter periplasmic adaptor subunit [Bacteroidetes bacterium]|nr:efflux RND transporter periplasmic adaptor subunit [Bacteroidota bacterium]